MACHNDDDSLLVHPYPAGTGRQSSLNCASCSIPTAGCAGMSLWPSNKESMAVQAVGGQPCLTRQSLCWWPFSQTDASPVVKVGFILCWVEVLSQLPLSFPWFRKKKQFYLGINAWLSFGFVCGNEFSLCYPSFLRMNCSPLTA